MNRKILLYVSILIFVVATCKTVQQDEVEPPRMRQVKPGEVAGYHSPIEMTIAWLPYKDLALKRTADDDWQVVKSDTTRSGLTPVILIRYPDRQDSVWLDMNTESAMLGKLIKHSLMTQEAIKFPYGSFLEEAKCTKCHPSDIKVDFEN